ncbi:MAG: endonuclease/exonuclease/phosphatase family protein [Nitrospirales bacterium]|nr:endonuclease/exonuclease/phosphatase family protein [Nitrospirales bacterium]
MRIRFGHFNIKDLTAVKLRDPEHPQVVCAAEIIRKFAPDILSINEMEAHPECPGLFAEHFLQRGEALLVYPYQYIGPTNSGIPTGLPHPFEQKGFGLFEGQYGIALFSRFPIITDEIRCFDGFPWSAMSGGFSCAGGLTGMLPGGFPLFSTNLIDIPIETGVGAIHVVLLHACIPVKGALNRQRNRDQLLFLKEYVGGGELPGEMRFDQGRGFVVMGDLNADPLRGGGAHEAVRSLLADPLFCSLPAEKQTFLAGGGVEDPSPGHDGLSLRLDYILPSRDFVVLENGVFLPDDPGWWKIARRASDHFFVYASCEINEGAVASAMADASLRSLL